jgi:hypothetical protein
MIDILYLPRLLTISGSAEYLILYNIKDIHKDRLQLREGASEIDAYPITIFVKLTVLIFLLSHSRVYPASLTYLTYPRIQTDKETSFPFLFSDSIQNKVGGRDQQVA